jgi:thioredoxin-like negative regulator of GroEL
MYHEDEDNFDRDVMTECPPQTEMKYEEVLRQAISIAIEEAAIEEVMERRRRIDADPEMEDWAFHAAENMMSVRDYTHVETWKVIDRLEAKLRDMTVEEMEILDRLITPIRIPF